VAIKARLASVLGYLRAVGARIANRMQSPTEWVARRLHVSTQWVAGFQFIVLIGLGFTMIQVDEYAFAGFFWTASALVLIARAIHWEGIQSHRGLTRFIRIAWSFGAFVFFIFMVVWTNAKKSDKPWSNLSSRKPTIARTQRSQPQVVPRQPTPQPADNVKPSTTDVPSAAGKVPPPRGESARGKPESHPSAARPDADQQLVNDSLELAGRIDKLCNGWVVRNEADTNQYNKEIINAKSKEEEEQIKRKYKSTFDSSTFFTLAAYRDRFQVPATEIRKKLIAKLPLGEESQSADSSYEARSVMDLHLVAEDLRRLTLRLQEKMKPPH
jgi:hypothetical protein